MSATNDFKNICKSIARSIPGAKFVETKSGGYFEKGNRKLGAVVSSWQKDNVGSSFKINKWKKGYGINVNPKHTRIYSELNYSVRKGLGLNPSINEKDPF